MTDKPANWVKTLASHYIELYRLEQSGEYERALKVCNKILHKNPNEMLAFHCKVICFIHMSKFEEAAHSMKNNPYSKNLHFEKAYCLYRCNKSQEALNVIDELEELDFRLLELKAQILYRLERFSEAYLIYSNLSQSEDEYDDEREINKGASLVYSGPDFINKYGKIIREDTHELCFNKACVLIASGQYAEAERKLRHCEKLCRDALEEDGLSEEEIQLELAHVKIQLAYIFQKQGRNCEALQAYIANLKLKLGDIALEAIASNNVVIINKDQNVFDSKRKLKAATNEAVNQKLMIKQRKFINLTKAMFNFYINQYDVCRQICDSIIKQWPDMIVYATVIIALISVKAGNYNDSVKMLEKCETTNDDDKFILQLVLAQLCLMQGERLKACEVLKNTGDNRYRPGIVGTLITLYLAEGKEDIAQNIYKETVEWYKVSKKTEGDLTKLWRQAAEFHLRNGQAQIAADSLEALLRENSNDKKALAQLVIAYAEFDQDKAIATAETLFDSNDLYEGIDIETVNNSIWLTAKKLAPNCLPAVGATPSTDSVTVIKKKKHRKRKRKLPKNYNSNIQPDPERWLPRYERAGYKKRRDRRVRDVIKGSQGTAFVQPELFDFSSKMPAESEPQESCTVELSPGNSGNKYHHKNKGLKKKN